MTICGAYCAAIKGNSLAAAHQVSQMIEADDVMIVVLTSQLSCCVHVLMYSSLSLCTSLSLACADGFFLSAPLLRGCKFLVEVAAFHMCYMWKRQDSCVLFLCNWKQALVCSLVFSIFTPLN
jgi:hypothetical protein